MYYSNKIAQLKCLFGSDNIILTDHLLKVDDKEYPVVDDVIILLEKQEYTEYVSKRLKNIICDQENIVDFAEDIQFTFGEEWKKYDSILPEHKNEFSQYFDLVDINNMKNKTVCDLGCGNGRWSYFLKEYCGELILVDFSDAIFTARKNLKEAQNALFFMCNLKKIPFKNNFADFLFCLGVLHHLPSNCLNEVRSLKPYANDLLIFLYYALDNRPAYFRVILSMVTIVRKLLSSVRGQFVRNIITSVITYSVYIPLIYLGKLLNIFKIGSKIPLYDFYNDKSIKRIKQDVYDRFFTNIEQRVTRKQIKSLEDTFSSVKISENIPYWHFVCRR